VRIDDPFIRYLTAFAQARLAQLRHAWRGRLDTDERVGEGGYSTETVIVTGLLVAAAIIAIGYIAVKIKAAAQHIKTE
jgi:hypothetical protein